MLHFFFWHGRPIRVLGKVTSISRDRLERVPRELISHTVSQKIDLAQYTEVFLARNGEDHPAKHVIVW